MALPSGNTFRCFVNFALRDISPEIEAAPRWRAHMERSTLNEVAIQPLREATGIVGEIAEPRRRDLSDVVGWWIAEPAVDEVRDEPRKVDSQP